MESNSKNEADCSTSSSTTIIAASKISKNNKFIKPRLSSKEHNVKRNDSGTSSNNSREDFYLNEKLACIKAPTVDLTPLDKTERKFSSKSRLYIGNLPPKVAEDSVTKLFAKYGEVTDVFVNDAKNFAFLKMDYYINALKAKTELNGYNFNGKYLVVRFAQTASIFIENLPSNVSDELLQLAFSAFGDVEHCTVVVDTYGKPTGKGIVHFAKRGSASLAKKRCAENSFFLTSSLKPVIVEDYEPISDMDGYAERQIRKTDEYYRSREHPPRFAKPGTFEYDYGKRWKEIQRKYKEQKDTLKNEMMFEEKKLEAEMLSAQYDHETERLKEMLRHREMERDRLNQQWNLNRPHSSLRPNIECGDDGRIKAETLYTQANQLTHLLDSQEQELQEKWNLSFSVPNAPPPERFDPWRNQHSNPSYPRAKRPRM